MLCAFVRNNIVVEVREVTEEELTTEVVNSYSQVLDVTNESPQPEVGWSVLGTVFHPPVGVSAPVTRRITKLALRNRLTFNEKLAIETLALNTANAYSLPLRVWVQDFQVSTFVDLNRAETIAGIGFLEQLGLIGVGRASQIINADITDTERFKG